MYGVKFVPYRAQLVMNIDLIRGDKSVIQVTKQNPITGTIIGEKTKRIANNDVRMCYFRPDGETEGSYSLSRKNFKRIREGVS
jgi:hypothetical protein